MSILHSHFSILPLLFIYAPPSPYLAGSVGVLPDGSQTYTQSPSFAQSNNQWASPGR